jgi:hypothetical protein
MGSAINYAKETELLIADLNILSDYITKRINPKAIQNIQVGQYLGGVIHRRYNNHVVTFKKIFPWILWVNPDLDDYTAIVNMNI